MNKNKMKTRHLWREKFRCGFSMDLYRKTIRSVRDLGDRKEQTPF